MLENKNWVIYQRLINKARIESHEKGELHHVIPRSLGGLDVAENRVVLTPRQHFVAHLLLTKCTTGEDRSKMCKALWMMKGRGVYGKQNVSSRLYETIREEAIVSISKASKRMWEDPETRRLLIEKKIGRKNTKSTRLLMSVSAKNRHQQFPHSLESRKRIGLAQATRVRTPEENERRKASANRKPKEKVVCPHCKKIGGKPVMIRYHFDSCKAKQ